MRPRKIKYNDLFLRAVEKTAPPTSLDITPQSYSADKDYELSYWGVKLLRRMFRLADEDYTISFSDRELAYDVLSGKSIKTIAEKRGVSYETIRNRVNAALDLLEEKMNLWENAYHREQELLDEVHDKEKEIQHLQDKNSEILKENNLLKDFVQLKEASNPAKIEVKMPQKKYLKSYLNDVKIPTRITRKLFSVDIFTVLDLVRCTEAQLRSSEVFTDYYIESIKSALAKMGLELGTDIRKVADLDEYYIYPSDNTGAGTKDHEQLTDALSVDNLALKNKVMSLESENSNLQERIKKMEAKLEDQASKLKYQKDISWKNDALAKHWKELYQEEKRQVSMLSKWRTPTAKSSPAESQSETENTTEKKLRSRIAELELLLARVKYEGRDIVINSDLI